MIDFSHIQKYRENNRIEAKKALGGLPESIWETYSAFANTLGGIILLGVIEKEDKSLATIDLPEPEELISEFWEIVNDPKRTSVNILSPTDVSIQIVDGNHIIVIQVPRAGRAYRPVYVGGDPLTGSYRRNGDGDYHCTREEYLAMVRDASSRSQDTLLLEGMDLTVLHPESIASYREQLSLFSPENSVPASPDDDFLFRIGAAAKGADKAFHPTSAGLLMFGTEKDIRKEFPHYLLDYREEDDLTSKETRILSSSGDWSGNVYDFYTRVYRRLTRNIHTPNSRSSDDAPVRQALREALTNCLINADYYGREGVVIIKRREAITLSNPGGFRIEIDAAKGGGISDPRNGAMLRMFNLIGIGAHTGSGLPNIFSVWNRQGWNEPVIEEQFEPDRITLSLQMKTEKDPPPFERSGTPTQAIAEYLTDHIFATCDDLSNALGLSEDLCRQILEKMVRKGDVVPKGEGKDCMYSLKT